MVLLFFQDRADSTGAWVVVNSEEDQASLSVF